MGALANATFPASTKALEPFRNDLTFVTNMDQPNYPDGYNWAHECYGVIYWGGPSTKPGSGKYHEPHGATLDQVIAKAQPLEAGQRLSLNLMAQVDNKPASGTAGCVPLLLDRAGRAHQPAGQPGHRVRRAVRRPRGGCRPPAAAEPTGPDPATAKLLGTQKSILDYVGKSLERFKMRVGREERGSIEGHFTAIRTLETEISGLGRPRPGSGGGLHPADADGLRQRGHRLAAQAVPATS